MKKNDVILIILVIGGLGLLYWIMSSNSGARKFIFGGTSPADIAGRINDLLGRRQSSSSSGGGRPNSANNTIRPTDDDDSSEEESKIKMYEPPPPSRAQKKTNPKGKPKTVNTPSIIIPKNLDFKPPGILDSLIDQAFDVDSDEKE
jgi:hypothetical protein